MCWSGAWTSSRKSNSRGRAGRFLRIPLVGDQASSGGDHDEDGNDPAACEWCRCACPATNSWPRDTPLRGRRGRCDAEQRAATARLSGRAGDREQHPGGGAAAGTPRNRRAIRDSGRIGNHRRSDLRDHRRRWTEPSDWCRYYRLDVSRSDRDDLLGRCFWSFMQGQEPWPANCGQERLDQRLYQRSRTNTGYDGADRAWRYHLNCGCLRLRLDHVRNYRRSRCSRPQWTRRSFCRVHLRNGLGRNRTDCRIG